MRRRRHIPTREDSVRFAIASAEIEGQTVSAETRVLLAEWAAGHISDDEMFRRALEPWDARTPAAGRGRGAWPRRASGDPFPPPESK